MCLMVVILGLLINWVVALRNGNSTNEPPKVLPKPRRAADFNSDIIIGGLFPVRLTEKDSRKCQRRSAKYFMLEMARGEPMCTRLNHRAMMWVEAMLFTIKEINSRNDILPGIVLGYDVRDTVNDVNYAIKAALDFTIPNSNHTSHRSDAGTNCSLSHNKKYGVINDKNSSLFDDNKNNGSAHFSNLHKTRNHKNIQPENVTELSSKSAKHFTSNADSNFTIPSSKIVSNYTANTTTNNFPKLLKFNFNSSFDNSKNDSSSGTSNSTTSNCSCDNYHSNCMSSVVAVVGGAGSEISKAINYILAVDDIPQISYSSTSPSLSDKNSFPSFLRTIPPDYIQAQVMADLISYYDWRYVSTIATDEDYGRLGIEALKKELKIRNVCISVDELFHHDYSQPTTKKKIKQIVQKLKQDEKANVVVLFCEGPNAFAVIEEAQRQGLKGKTWIGPESWGDSNDALQFKYSTIGGMLGVVPWKGNIDLFAKHMASLNPTNTDHNPWFKDYWEGDFRCKQTYPTWQGHFNVTNSSNSSWLELNANNVPTWECPGYKSPNLPNAGKAQLNKAPNVMDSVYAIALALHKLLNCTSNVMGSCPGSRVVPRDLLSYIKRSDFTGKLGYPIKFDKFGDTKGNYLIKTLQPDNSSPYGKKFVTIGYWRWIDSKLIVNIKDNVWNSGTRDKPVSRCSIPCSQGEYPVQGGSPCCWTCVQCAPGSIKNVTGSGRCTPCKKGHTSDRTHSKCLELPMLYLQWGEVTAIIILGLSAVGLITTGAVLCVYLKFSETAIVKASTREFTFLMLIIIALMFALVILYIGKPSFVACQVRPFLFAFIITFWTSLMLTKTNRLLLIFKSKRIPLRDGMLNIRFQLVLAIMLTFIILVIALVWVLIYQPEVTYHYADTHVIIDCGNQSDKILIITMGYTAVLAITTTFLAYKARNLPENFNETRYIGFSMFTFCIIWLTYIPLYYGTDPALKYVCLCFCLIVTGFSALISMFFNRLRIILFHPDQNRTEVIRANMFVYTMRDKNGGEETAAARNMRRTSVVTVGNFMLPTAE